MLALALGAVAVSGASQWSDLFTPPLFTDNPVPISLAIDCVAQGHCYLAGGTPTTGFAAYKVNDPFFRQVQRLKVNSPIPLVMLMGIAMRDDTHAVAAGLGLGVGGTYYTVNGKEFNASLQVGLLTSQDVTRLPKSWPTPGYAYVGQYNANRGAAVSHTAGVTFKGQWWPKGFAKEAPPRYGAFPSPQTWYVTGGSWPSDSDAADFHYMTRRLRVHRKTGVVEHVGIGKTANDATNGSYTGVITKTADGGATWTVQYNSSGRFYFNGVDCISETHCIAVGEGFANDGSTAPGAHVLMTTDGETWEEVYVFEPQKGGSVIAVKMLSETEAWVAAAYASSVLDSGAVMLHSVDGGKTWTQSPKLGSVGTVMSLAFIDSDHAYAVGIGFAQTSTVLCYGCGTPPAPAPGTGNFQQKQCNDAACSKGCNTIAFPQGECIPAASGGSVNVTCSSDGSELITEVYTSADCSGTPQKKNDPTNQCLQASTGGYFEDICPPAAAAAAVPSAGDARVRVRA